MQNVLVQFLDTYIEDKSNMLATFRILCQGAEHVGDIPNVLATFGIWFRDAEYVGEIQNMYVRGHVA